MRRRASPCQLYRSWQARRRPTWPDTYEACIADPLLFQLIEIHALQCERARKPKPVATRWASPAPAVIDRKRLAAGEKEED